MHDLILDYEESDQSMPFNDINILRHHHSPAFSEIIPSIHIQFCYCSFELGLFQVMFCQKALVAFFYYIPADGLHHLHFLELFWYFHISPDEIEFADFPSYWLSFKISELVWLPVQNTIRQAIGAWSSDYFVLFWQFLHRPVNNLKYLNFILVIKTSPYALLVVVIQVINQTVEDGYVLQLVPSLLQRYLRFQFCQDSCLTWRIPALPAAAVGVRLGHETAIMIYLFQIMSVVIIGIVQILDCQFILSYYFIHTLHFLLQVQFIEFQLSGPLSGNLDFVQYIRLWQVPREPLLRHHVWAAKLVHWWLSVQSFGQWCITPAAICDALQINAEKRVGFVHFGTAIMTHLTRWIPDGGLDGRKFSTFGEYVGHQQIDLLWRDEHFILVRASWLCWITSPVGYEGGVLV